ncbi:hypothetical protein [Haloferula sargassicola]|uniref:hypothetical protein n=1 Tax=Haloferula sargassicola TaxID=490096 RepID=UPI0033657D67
MRRTTSKKKFRATLRGLKDWLKASRSVPLRDQVVTLSRKLQGHWNYFGVIGNSVRLWQLLHHVRHLASNGGTAAASGAASPGRSLPRHGSGGRCRGRGLWKPRYPGAGGRLDKPGEHE